MKSLYGYLIEPIGERYNNTKDVDGKELILNSEIYNHQYTNRRAKVLSVPLLGGDGEIKPGDEIIVHHNIFRRWHDVKGVERNSKSFFDDNKYIVNLDQIYLYKRKGEWKPIKGFCFVQPIKRNNVFGIDNEHSTRGIVKYTDGSVDKGDLVGFTPFSKYEFIIDGKKLYRVYSKFITIKYEYQGDEEVYNPSWAQGS